MVLVCIGTLLGVVLHIGTFSSEAKLVGGMFVVAMIGALLFSAPGRGNRWIGVDIDGGMKATRLFMESIFEQKKLKVGDALLVRIVLGMRITLAILLGLSTAVVVIPAIRFARWLYVQYIRSSSAAGNEEDTDGRSMMWQRFMHMVLILDAVFPILASVLFLTSIENDIGKFTAGVCSVTTLQLIFLLLSCTLRLFLFRLRIRDYLSTALAHIQVTLAGGGQINPEALEQKIFSIHFFVAAIALQYIAPILIPFASALICLLRPFQSYPLTFTIFHAVAFWSSISWSLLYISFIALERITDTIVPEVKLKRT